MQKLAKRNTPRARRSTASRVGPGRTHATASGDFYDSVAQLAADLKMSLRATYTGLRRGEIPHRRVGSKYILHRPTITAWALAAVKQ